MSEREKQKSIFVSERASYNGEAMLYKFIILHKEKKSIEDTKKF